MGRLPVSELLSLAKTALPRGLGRDLGMRVDVKGGTLKRGRSTWRRARSTRASTRSRNRKCTSPGDWRQEDTAGVDAVFQAGELFSGEGSVDPGGWSGTDWQRLRLLDSAQPPKEAIEAWRCLAKDPDYYHSATNLTKGEKPGERDLANHGYRPG